MLKLGIAQDSVGIAGSVAVGWTIDQETMEEICQRLADCPPSWLAFLLFVTAPQAGYHVTKERRWIAPLDAKMTFVDFVRPGENQIFVKIVLGQLSPLRDRHLATEDGKFKTTVLQSDGSGFLDPEWKCDAEYDLARYQAELQNRLQKSDWSEAQRLEIRSNFDQCIVEEQETLQKYEVETRLFHACKCVTLSSDSFADPIPHWERAFLTWQFRWNGADECDWRRRRLWAWPATLVALLVKIVFMIAHFLVLHACLIVRGFDYAALRNPISYDFVDVTATAEYLPLRALRRMVHDDSLTWRDRLWIGAIPASPLVIIVSAFITRHVYHVSSWLKCLLAGFMIPYALVVFCAFLWTCGKAWNWLNASGARMLWTTRIVAVLGLFATVWMWSRIPHYVRSESEGMSAMYFFFLIVCAMTTSYFVIKMLPSALGWMFDRALSLFPDPEKPASQSSVDLRSAKYSGLVREEPVVRLQQIPWRERPIKLVYLDMKSRACKPFVK